MKNSTFIFLTFLFVLFYHLPLSAQCNALEIPNNGIDEDCDGLDDLFLTLPPYIYTVEGQDLEIYFSNTILSKHPQDYFFSISSLLIGTVTSTKWKANIGNNAAGDYPLTLNVKTANGQVLSVANTTVRVSPDEIPASVSPKKLILMGHSFFDQGYLPKYIYDKCQLPGNPAISLHGKKVSWADANARHEGYGGQMARWFINNPSSPIKYGSTFSIRKYFNDVICTNCNPDWIIIHLDLNDFCGYTALTGNTIQEIQDSITMDWNRNFNRIIDSIRVTTPTTKIGICMSPPPNARQSAFDLNFPGNPVLSNRWRWKKIIACLAQKQIQRYGNRESENIFLIPEYLDLDDLNEYSTTEASHPDPISGYGEIAKSIYSWIRWVEFNSTVTISPCSSDIVKPVISNCPTTIVLTTSGATAIGSWTAPTATDNCTANPTLTASHSSGLAFPTGSTTVVYTAKDAANNTSTCSFVINVTSSSVSTCTGNLLQNSGFESDLTNWEGLGAQIGTGQNVSSGTKSLKLCTIGNVARQTLLATSGKTYTLTWKIKTAGAGQNILIGLKFFSASYLVLGDQYTNFDSPGQFDSGTFSKLAPTGTVRIEIAFYKQNSGCIYVDELCLTENSGTINPCSPDIIAPIIVGCPANISVTAAVGANIVTAPQWISPTATDNCIGTINLSTTHQSGAAFPIGTTSVLYTAKDAANNSATCTFTVTVMQNVTGTCIDNMLKNPGFENNLTNWNGIGAEIGTSPNAVSGTKSLKMCNAGNTVYQTLPAIAGKNYKFQYTAKTLGTNQNILFGLKFFSASWQDLGAQYSSFDSPMAFSSNFIQKIAPIGTAWVEVTVVKENSGCVYVDDLCLTTDTGNTGGGTSVLGADLEITMAADKVSVPQWGNFTVTVTAKNTGTLSITNAVIKMSGCSSIDASALFDQNFKVLYAGTPAPPSTGTYNFVTQLWTLPNGLAPGATATLTLPLFTTGTGERKIVANVVSQLPSDTDSQPSVNNLVNCTPIQDDEAVWTINMGQAFHLSAGRDISDNENLSESVVVTDYQLFPNPAGESVFVKMPHKTGKIQNCTATISIINQMGFLTKEFISENMDDSTEVWELSLSDVNNGVYFLKIAKNGERAVVRKLIVSRMY
jgi:hypothetical protein